MEKPFSINNNKAESAVLKPFVIDKMRLPWVNSQLPNQAITCLVDGHDGVWNLFNQIGTTEQRREVLDWYHLRENLHKVGGSLKRKRRVESQLWQESTVEALAEFVGVRGKESENFQNDLRKH